MRSICINNAYTILNCDFSKEEASLILIDPFADFLRDKEIETVIPDIASFIKIYKIPILLFVLNLKPENSRGIRYKRLRDNNFQNLNEIALICQKLNNTGVRGESNYISEARLLFHPESLPLQVVLERVTEYKSLLEKVLGTNIEILNRLLN